MRQGGEDLGGHDSKATNPHAAAAALSAFDSVVWIAGGLGKGARFDSLEDALAGRVRAAVTIGASGPDIAAVTRRLGIPTVEAEVLSAAVEAAARLARSGDVVLLAPACASLDQFADYAARGDAFRRAVGGLERDRQESHGR
jgi:UDP-N-acetylmuramoylalanine--D-glutamate ligase